MTGLGATILIVDDEVKNLKLLEILLQHEGYRTVSAASGDEALALIAQRAPDLILLDVMMPGTDGYQVARLLKANPATSSIPIIMVTALVDRDARMAGLNAGAEEFLSKPFDRSELWLRVRNLLRLKAFGDFLKNHNAILEQKVQDRTADLQDEAARQVAILNALPAHIAFLDKQGLIISVNVAWRHFASSNALQGPNNGIGLNYIEICEDAQGEDAAQAFQVAAGIRSVLGSRLNSYSLEYPCHSPAEQRWFLMTVNPLAGVPPNGVVVMHLNITERKRAENELQELTQKTERRERILSTTLSSIIDFTYIYDRDGRFLFANQPLLNLLGITAEAIVGKNSFDLGFPDELAAKLQRQVQEVFKTNRSLTDVTVFTAPDGLEGFYEYIFSPVVALDGTVEFVAGATRDITARKQAEATLRQSEARLQEAQRIARLGNWDWDLTTNALYWSEEIYRIFELTPQQFSATYPAFLERVHPLDRSRVMAAVDAAVHAAVPYDIDHRIVLPDGRERMVHENGVVFRDETGQSLRMAGTVQDITERKEAEDRIVYLNRVYAMLNNLNSLIVRARDRDGMFSEACRIAVEAGGFRMAMIAIVDRNTTKIVPVASAGKDEKLLTAIKGILSSSEGAPNTMIARAIGEKNILVSNDSQSDPQVLFGKKYTESGIRSLAVFPLIVSDEAVGVLALYASEIEFFHEEEVKLLTGLAGDIAFSIDHIDKQERLNYLAYYDDLTGLANRTLFLERVAQCLRSALSGAHQLAVFLIDLERFKSINDSLGRPAGDELLRQVAQWLIRNAAGDANLLARVGADHFAVVMPVVKREGNLPLLLEKWMETFQNHPFRLNDAVFRIALKVGVALFPDDGADADTLFRNAEAALKKAKAIGDRYLFHTHKMTESVAGNLSLENQLRQALDNGEFVLHYQPKVNLASGKLTGAEALIRWNDPRTGLVPPGHFIPILEETGLIHEVGRWALRQAIADYLRWRAAGLPVVRIAVNVSPLQLRHHGFIAEIEQAISIDPQAVHGLELEITESVIMADINVSIATLQAIRAMGICIAIDDFGTGFSSLSYLARLPVHTLKIDRSFVIDMTVGPQGLALVSTIISLAHALNLKVVAEGVETEEQSRLLRLLHCDEMQGFLFSKPVPGEIFQAKFLTPAAAT